MLEISKLRPLFPGLAIACLVAISAQFLSDHYGVPTMLMAILLGISLQFLSEETGTRPGIEFAAKGLLRLGVALLGVRVSVEMVAQLGPAFLSLIVAAVGATIFISLVISAAFGRDRMFGFLAGGAVAICGASAAMAISSVLPARKNGDRDLAFTVVSVTVLSTLAMIAYPIIAVSLGLDLRQTGVFLGGTIHDVAQVVGAGYSISEDTGDLATVVKLIRVTLLAPVVLIGSLLIRANGNKSGPRPPLIPGFVLAFLVLAGLNSLGVLPHWAKETASLTSGWALVIAISAVGMKTSIAKLREVGGSAIILLSMFTFFLAGFVLLGLYLL